MSNNNHLKTRAAAGAVLVALSGFVPTPMVQDALADTTTINVTGKFISGITLSNPVAVKLDTIVPTANTGNMGIDVAGAPLAGNTNGTFIGTQANGSIKIKAAVIQPIDIKLAGFGKLTLTGTTAGSATLTRMDFGKTLTATATFKGGTATKTVTKTGLNLKTAVTTASPGTFDIGASVAWSGGRPQGGFSQAVTVTVTY